jgi:hypothetical protein
MMVVNRDKKTRIIVSNNAGRGGSEIWRYTLDIVVAKSMPKIKFIKII